MSVEALYKLQYTYEGVGGMGRVRDRTEKKSYYHMNTYTNECRVDMVSVSMVRKDAFKR